MEAKDVFLILWKIVCWLSGHPAGHVVAPEGKLVRPRHVCHGCEFVITLAADIVISGVVEGEELTPLADLVEHYEAGHVPSAPWKTGLDAKYNAGRCTTMSMERLGLALDRHHMVWAVNHGVGQWAPRWVQQMIVCAWNWLSCRLLGHDHLVQEEPNGPAHCVSCCRNLRVTPGMPLIRVWEDDHDDDTSDAV